MRVQEAVPPSVPLQRLQQPMLIANDIRVAYQSGREPVVAVEKLSFAIDRGEFVSILGPSGCGKSTLLKVACGLLRPTKGAMLLDGVPVTGPRRDVGIVFQQPTLLPWKTVIGNVLVPCQALGMDRTASQATARDLLKLVGLDGFADRYPGDLSGGMQQRVGLARSLVHDPSLLLMDEPFAALDAMTRERMAGELQRIWMKASKSILFITHSIPEAVFLSDRIIVLSDRPGRVIDEITVDLERPRSIETMTTPEFGKLCLHLRGLFGASNAFA